MILLAIGWVSEKAGHPPWGMNNNPVDIEEEIRRLADKYAANLEARVERRVKEMESDDRSHHLIYRVLGVADEEGSLIDIYQNKGRFLYRYAGSFLEEAAKLCFRERYPDSASVRIPNTLG